MINYKFSAITAIAIITLILCSSYSYSDDSFIADHGSNVSPAKTTDISMVEEEVIIKVEDYVDNKIAVFPLRKAHVKCTFLFQNTSDKLIKATVGFPGNVINEPKYSDPITNFVTVIEGRKYRINVKRETLKRKNKNTDECCETYRNWYVWDMTFPPNSTVKVENSYLHYLSAPSGYEPFYLNYELSTGANWKGPIGKASIKVIYNNAADLDKRVCDIKPKGWIRKQNQIIWNFENIKPTLADNIIISESNIGYDYPGMKHRPLLFKSNAPNQ